MLLEIWIKYKDWEVDRKLLKREIGTLDIEDGQKKVLKDGSWLTYTED